MEFSRASVIASNLLVQVEAHCSRAMIAGSLRRLWGTDDGTAQVKDIELVAVPCWMKQPTAPAGLFGEVTMEPVNLLHRWALSEACPVRWIKPGTSEIVDWAPKPDGKYWRGLIEGIKVDLFLTRPENFGVIELIRTGSADFSHEVAAHAQRTGRPFRDGQLWHDGEWMPMPDEVAVFEFLGLVYVPPERRTGAAAVQRVSAHAGASVPLGAGQGEVGNV